MDQQKLKLIQPKPIGPDRLHSLPADEDKSREDVAKWSGSFYFVQAADTQLGLIDRYIKRVEPVGWDEEIRLCELLVSKCNKLNPEPAFMVVCGDLTDADPSRMKEMRTNQVIDFKRIFAKLNPKIPLICLCGNHDVGDEPTNELIAEYRRDFGDDYFYFVTRGVLFIVINSQFYKHRELVQEYAAGQDDWLMEVLKKCKLFKYSIVFEHIPWFLNGPNEDDEYFNIDRAIRLQWLERFHAAGVTKIMCGHYHRNAGGWFRDMELVVTSAVGAQLGPDSSGARLVRLLDDGIQHSYYSLESIPEQVGDLLV